MIFFVFFLVFSFILNAEDIAVSTASGNQLSPSIASNGTDYLVVWEDHRSGVTNKNIFGNRFQSDGTVTLDFMSVCVLAGNQSIPDISFNGDYFVTAWLDTSGNVWRRASSSNEFLEDAILMRSITGASSIRRIRSSGSSNGNAFVWQHNPTSGDRSTASGVFLPVPVGSTPSFSFSFTSSLKQTMPDIASLGSDGFCVVYWDSSTTSSGIKAVFTDIEGRVISESLIYNDETNGTASFPSVAYSDGYGFISWQVQSTLSDNDIFGVSFHDGVFSSPFAITSGGSPEQKPSVSCGNGVFLVVFEDYTDSYYSGISGAFFRQNGTPLGSVFSISSVSAQQLTPRAAYAEGTFFVVWEDRRNTTADIYGSIVTIPETPPEFSFDLFQGWNLVSFPFSNTITISAYFTDAILPVYSYNPLTRSYTSASSNEVGKGYWILYPHVATVITDMTHPEDTHEYSFETGWNLIGTPDSPILVSSLVSSGSVIEPVYSYNPATRSYSAVDSLIPGKAYWVLCSGSFTIELP